MASDTVGPAVQVGQPAPEFRLAAADHDGTVSLSEFVGRGPVLVALMRGIQCPFCRRNLALLGKKRQKLQALGADVLAVVATTPDRARVYFKHHLVSIPIAADPDMATHRAYGVPCYPLTPELERDLRTVRVDPFDELPEPVPFIAADGTEIHDVFDRRDGFIPTDVDQQDRTKQFRKALQLCAQYLVDREGIVRWVFVEGDPGGLAASGIFPPDDQLFAATRALK